MDDVLAWPRRGKLNITIVGAGNLAHVLVGMWGNRSDLALSMLTRKADQIRDGLLAGIRVKELGINKNTPDQYFEGKCVAVSSNPEDVIPSADFVIITAPSHARPALTDNIVPHLARNKKVFIGVMPGMGGFDWIAKKACEKHNRDNVVIWAVKDVPYMSAWTVPGKSATNLGCKKSMFVALALDKKVSASQQSAEANVIVHVLKELTKKDDIKIEVLDTYMVITLTPGNPIMHPSIMYGMFGPHSQWDGKPLKEKPLFYEEVSELSSHFLSLADKEVQNIKNAIQKMTGADLTPVWPLRENIKNVYGERCVDNRTLMLAMRSNRGYATVRTPLKEVEGGFMPNVNHRFFDEDVPYGLAILHDVGQMVGVQTPMIDELLCWGQKLMGKEYLVDGQLRGKDAHETGAPRVYGIFNVFDLIRSPKVSANL